MHYNYYETEARCRGYVQDAQKEIKRTALQWTIAFGLILGTLSFGTMLDKDLKKYIPLVFFAFLSMSALGVMCVIALWCYHRLSMARLRKYIIKLRALGDEE